MISRQEVLDLLIHECEVCKHLYSKVPKDAFDFRPTEKQRSTTELLRYLSICGSAPLHVMHNDSDWKQWKPFTEHSTQMSHEEFPAAMDKQIEDIKRLLAAFSDDDLTKEAKSPRGETMTVGMGIISMSLTWLTAYRMQLFLYAKQSGASEIGTSNNWAGKERPQPQS
jgi:hypothetical protein